MSTAAQTDQLTALWDELGAPSLKNFQFALTNRGISVPAAEIRKFVSLQSERQIAQPGNRYTGKVVAFYENDRWAVDIISYVSRPVKDKDSGKKFQYVLHLSRYVHEIHSNRTPDERHGSSRCHGRNLQEA